MEERLLDTFDIGPRGRPTIQRAALGSKRMRWAAVILLGIAAVEGRRKNGPRKSIYAVDGQGDVEDLEARLDELRLHGGARDTNRPWKDGNDDSGVPRVAYTRCHFDCIKRFCEMIGVDIRKERSCGRDRYTMVGGREETHSVRPHGRRDAILYSGSSEGRARAESAKAAARSAKAAKAAHPHVPGKSDYVPPTQPGPMAL